MSLTRLWRRSFRSKILISRISMALWISESMRSRSSRELFKFCSEFWMRRSSSELRISVSCRTWGETHQNNHLLYWPEVTTSPLYSLYHITRDDTPPRTHYIHICIYTFWAWLFLCVILFLHFLRNFFLLYVSFCLPFCGQLFKNFIALGFFFLCTQLITLNLTWFVLPNKTTPGNIHRNDARKLFYHSCQVSYP